MHTSQRLKVLHTLTNSSLHLQTNIYIHTLHRTQTKHSRAAKITGGKRSSQHC